MAVSPKVISLIVGCDDGRLLPHYGLVYEEKLWLVPSWRVDNEREALIPERMIQLDWARSTLNGPESRWDYTVSMSLPKDVLDGRSLSLKGYEVRIHPNEPTVDPRQIKPLAFF